VLIQSQPWQFEGQGIIEPMPENRFNVTFDLRFHQMRVVPDGGRVPGGESQIGGSIYTPLGHYTVMGTTTFVAQRDAPDGEGASQQQQNLSAFVVYLDRAREFPATSTEARRNQPPR
jgi:hypothetical protein